jgi:predicted Zn-dependent protease
MEPDPTVLASLRKAVEAMPDDVPLRVHLASLLLQAGQRDEAIRHVGAVLQRDPANAEALALLQRPAGPPATPDAGGGAGAGAGAGATANTGHADAGRTRYRRTSTGPRPNPS